MIFSDGEPEAEIVVVLASRRACFISTVPIPLKEEFASPTWIVLITPVVPIPTPEFGIKSIFKEDPLKYALYVPRPDDE